MGNEGLVLRLITKQTLTTFCLLLKRRLKDQFHHARATVCTTGYAKRTAQKIRGVVSSSDLVVDNELSFRALDASWERNVPCGFDVRALEILFPEEMNAYRRWKKVRYFFVY